MLVKELIEKLQEYPQDARVGKVSLSDDTGSSDSEMVAEDWNVANVKNTEGVDTGEKIVFCSFGELVEEGE